MSSNKDISVIICSYNRAKFIPGVLNSMIEQGFDRARFEVIVVNNNCTDNTSDLVNQYIKNNPSLDLRMVMETNQGLSFARNRGIAEANAAIINYIDDDGVAAPDFLETLWEYFKMNPSHVGVGGKVIPIYEKEEPLWYNPYLRMMVTSIDFGDRSFKCSGKKYPAGCNMSYRKNVLIEAGGFNNALKWRADDKYIYKQVQKLSNEIYYYPSLRVQHHIDADRTTDKNFDRLSGLLGSEERLRILSDAKWKYPFKLAEFIFKYFASILIAIAYTLKGQWIKGKYVIRFRWLALLKYLGL